MGEKLVKGVVALPFRTFEEATTSVLKSLQNQSGLDLWMMTRTEEDDWIVLSAEDNGYNVTTGQIFRWSDSFCSRMVQGLGPRIAPEADKILAYRAAPIGRQVPIGAYVGVPISLENGDLFGTLCAIDPEPQPETLNGMLDQVELSARLLATILQKELAQQEELRRAERARYESETDFLTGLYNRRGWNRLCNGEERRGHLYGEPFGIIIVDLDGLKWVNDTLGHDAGDQLLERAATILRQSVLPKNIVARLGGDEFAILITGAEVHQLENIEQTMFEALADASISASLGSARWNPQSTLCETEKRADERMYRRKQQKAQMRHMSQIQSKN